ncbi:MAG: ABC transporter ATP-binding protein/permease [candidate division WOR-3 bacterium]|nr:ABC transporter ATP-binding protein/permease [candidate division WOR-3 bacterium]MCX7836809.1 ABC transporter ATP-binding protein/permease [candidate division WOR-3 bacterium]MDW8113874.1 ABC transporter ATP-binding protein [candidate division WOR-3 bacterium]
MYFHLPLSEEEIEKTKFDIKILKFLFPYFRAHSLPFIFINILLLLNTGIMIISPILLKRIIDVNIANKDYKGLLLTVLIYALLSVLSYFLNLTQRVEITKLGERIASEIKKDIFSHLLFSPITFFDKTPVGKIITRNESDVESLKMLFTSAGVVLFQDLVFLIGISVVMIIVSPLLYLILFFLFPLFFLAFYFFSKKIRPIYLTIRRKVSEINNLISETLQGLFIIQVFKRENYFKDKMDNLGKEKLTLEIKGMSYWYKLWFLIDFGEVLALTLILFFGSLLALKGKTTIGTLVLFFSYIIRLFQPLRGLSDLLNVFQRAIAAGERIFTLKKMEREEEGDQKELLKKFEKSIRFSNVNFAYLEEVPVLHNINLEIKKGEKIALVGATGSGKTTIISLLLGFYQPTYGEIFIDDIPYSKIPKSLIRRLISYVPQEIILFPGSVLDNLRLFDSKISEEKVISATKKVKIYERIMEFPEKFDTNILERGINLSLGERQLLSFARAMVFEPEIIILDEATSSVDPHTELLIQEGLFELWKGKTAIVIAHRLSTIKNVDRIIVIHKGRIVEEGNHEELLKKEGYYYKLYQLQYV